MVFHSRVSVVVKVSREGQPEVEREYRLADQIAASCGAFSCKGGGSAAIARVLVKNAHELWARLNVEFFHAPPADPQAAALETIFAAGAEDHEPLAHRVSLAAPAGAAAKLAAILPREQRVGDSQASTILDAIAHTDASGLAGTLCEFAKGKHEEDLRYYAYKAVHAAGGPDAQLCFEAAVKGESDSVDRALLQWYLLH